MTVNEFILLLVLHLNFGNVLAFLTRVHWAANWEFKVQILFLNQIPVCHRGKRGVKAGIFLLFKDLLMMGKFFSGAVMGLSNLALNLAIYFSFAWIISLVHSLAWLFKRSLLYSEGFL